MLLNSKVYSSLVDIYVTTNGKVTETDIKLAVLFASYPNSIQKDPSKN